MLQFELYGTDRIPVQSDDVLGVTNDADVGPVAVSYTAGPARILRRAIIRVDSGGGDRDGDGEAMADPRTTTGGDRATGPEVGGVYEFSVVPFALQFSLNADVGMAVPINRSIGCASGCVVVECRISISSSD